MDWTLVDDGSAHRVATTGRIDESNWEAFTDALLAAVRTAMAAGRMLVLDLSGIDYMSSRGLRALTVARKEAGDTIEVALAAPNPRMREILAISRYDKIFRIMPE